MRQKIAKEKAEREAALKKGKEATVQQQQKPSQAAAAAVAAPVKKEYDTCRLQVAIVNINCSFLWCYYRSDCLEVVLSFSYTFKTTDTLVDVNCHIIMNRTDDGSPYTLVTNFPTRECSSQLT